MTEKELSKAIDECLKEPISGTKRGILADLIIIQDYLFGYRDAAPFRSSDNDQITTTEIVVSTTCDSDFLCKVNGKKSEKAWKLIDELVESVKILHPRMYNTFMQKIQDL